MLSFIRIYSGSLTSNSSVYNVNKEQTEKFNKLMVAFADDFREVDEIRAGNIAVVSGLKLSITGDTIVESSGVAKSALKAANDEGSSETALASPFIPEPVFFCCIEPPSLAAQKQFDQALECISREDPSLRVNHDTETGQTVLGGMGELHLEIVVDRIKTGWKVDADVGKLQVAYREIPCEESSCDEKFERRLSDRTHLIQMALQLKPVTGKGLAQVEWSKEGPSVETFSRIKPQIKKIVENGIKSGLQTGPLLGYPVLDCVVTIQSLQLGRGTSTPMISAGATFITRNLIKHMDVRLAEPLMNVEVICEDDVVDTVLQDLRRRRGEVDYLHERSAEGQMQGISLVRGFVPLAELRGYSSELRTLTSGKANISMELSHYQLMSEYEQSQAIEEVTGFAAQ